MRALTLIASGGVAAAAAGIFLGYKKAAAVKNSVLAATGGDAMQAKDAGDKAKAATTPAAVQAAATQAQAAAYAAPPSSPDIQAAADVAVSAAAAAVTPSQVADASVQVQDVAAKMVGDSTVQIAATGYWPFQEGLSDAARKMEGAPVDRRGKPLHTVEDFFAGKSDHVSISGDDAIFPYGQLLKVAWFDKVLDGRVTDTGGHFRGAGKVQRFFGKEPLDFCVASSKTPVPKLDVVATIVRGNHLDKAGKDVAVAKFKGQVVVGSLFMLGAV